MADGVKIRVVGDDSDFQNTLSSIGTKTSSVFKGIMASQLVQGGFTMIKNAFKGIANAGLTAAKSIVSAFGNREQLIGGIETLFKDSASVVEHYANQAYKTAGISANEYMETVTSFSASLISSLGGDTAKAAEKANMALTDMSDNANKMGSDMSSIQNAYQGFAKQNYTMLDNLNTMGSLAA